MSTEKNKAVVRRIIEEAFNKGNLKVADELIATNWVYHGSGGMEFKGPEGFKQFVTMFRTAFPDLHMMIEDIVAEGDKVAQRYTFRGIHKGDFMGIAPTGRHVTIPVIAISRLADGKDVETWELGDRLGMFQQMGLIPPMGGR